MLIYRDITRADEEILLKMMGEFYCSEAVCTPPPAGIIERNVASTLDEANTACRGVLVEEDGTPVGYFIITTFYSGEVAGTCVQVEQVYVSATCRGKGYGKQMMAWLRADYPDALRFQLEVNEGGNPAAVHVYEKSDYLMNPYKTMYINL